VAISYFKAFGDVVYEATPSGTLRSIAAAELVRPGGPAERYGFCLCCGNDLGDTGFLFPVKSGRLHLRDDRQTGEMDDIPDGITVHQRTECGGAVPDRQVVDITPGSWKSELGVERESEGLRAEAASRSFGAG
jgi:hypothetical protein